MAILFGDAQCEAREPANIPETTPQRQTQTHAPQALRGYPGRPVRVGDQTPRAALQAASEGPRLASRPAAPPFGAGSREALECPKIQSRPLPAHGIEIGLRLFCKTVFRMLNMADAARHRGQRPASHLLEDRNDISSQTVSIMSITQVGGILHPSQPHRHRPIAQGLLADVEQRAPDPDGLGLIGIMTH